MPPLQTKSAAPQVRLAPPLELKFEPSPGATGAIEGYASVFRTAPDGYGDVIAPGAFARSPAEHKAAGQVPAMLWSHDPSEPIGRWTELREDHAGLFVKGALNLETSRGKDVHAFVRAGDVTGLSIGYRVRASENTAPGSGTRLLTEVELVEVSVVVLPAQPMARITLSSKRELEDLLHKSGLPKAAASRLADGGWPALTRQSEPPDDPDMRAVLRTLDRHLLELKGLV